MADATDPVELDALDLARAIRARRLSCIEVMTAFLDRIERLNPAVNAIVSLRPREELLREAGTRDHALACGEPLGWLHGLPLAVKDLALTKGLRTTFGSPLFADLVPTADDVAVARLRAAGAILIGKTNTPEFGLGSQTFNPVFGTTRNAYDQGRRGAGPASGAGGRRQRHDGLVAQSRGVQQRDRL